MPQSTVGYERRFSPALGMDEPRFVDFILEGQPEPPLYFARMKQQNRDGVPLLGSLPRPMALEGQDIQRAMGPDTGVVVDTRSWAEFRQGHLPGSLFAPLGSNFHSVAGSYIEPEQTILLVAEQDRVEDAVRELVRIGLDHVIAYVTPAALRASGQATARAEEIDAATAATRIDNDSVTVLDVRRATELTQGRVNENALHAAHTLLPRHLDELPRDRPLLVHCASGVRSSFATAYLMRHGFQAINLAGGSMGWRKQQQPATALQTEGKA